MAHMHQRLGGRVRTGFFLGWRGEEIMLPDEVEAHKAQSS